MQDEFQKTKVTILLSYDVTTKEISWRNSAYKTFAIENLVTKLVWESDTLLRMSIMVTFLKSKIKCNENKTYESQYERGT